MPSCAVIGCNNYNRLTKGTKIRYFTFPKDEDLCKRWIMASRRADEINLKNACVCSAHFEPNCFVEPSLRHRLLNYRPKNRRVLKPEAVPTLNMPGKRNIGNNVVKSVRLEKRGKIERTSPVPMFSEISGNSINTLDISDQPGTSYSASDPLEKITEDKDSQDATNTFPVRYHKCPICPYMTTLDSQFERHMMTQCLSKKELFDCTNSIESLTCMQCANFETHELVDLRQHLRAAHAAPSEELLQSKDCWILSDSVKMDHTYAKDEFQNCEHCPFATTWSDYLKEHILVEHTTHLKGNLKRHSFNGGKTKFKCDHCPFETKYKQTLENHALFKHTDPGKVQWFECQDCGYRTKVKRNLERHVNYKHGEKLILRCDHCLYETNFKLHLKKHVLLKHSDQEKNKWLHCTFCSYKSRIDVNMEKHVKNAQCRHCQRGFNCKRNLQRHILQEHTDPLKIRHRRQNLSQNVF